jgi:Double zinc ribbon
VSEVYVLLAVVVILVVIVAAILLLVLGRLKRRRAQLLSELSGPPRLVSDRAFNRLEMARREAAILGRQGADTSRARELIAQSQAALDQRQFARSYELAQSAHEALVHVRTTGTLPSSGTVTPAVAPPASSRVAVPRPVAAPSAAAAPSTPVGGGLDAAAPVPRLAPNRAESQFQIRLLDGELDDAKAKRSSPAMLATAGALRSQAQSSFDHEQYTDALRFALRGRRELGGNVESLAPGPAPPPPAAGDRSNGGSGDPSLVADRTASGARCPQCGYPALADDAFCRGCGLPRTPTTCAKCGAARTPSDTFCGRCGQRFS